MLVVPIQNDEAIDFIATRGFGGAGVSKTGAIIQGTKLGYKLARYGYKRYFGYATRTRSRAMGTATGAGIGIGGGLVAILTSNPERSSTQIRQTRGNMEFSKRKRFDKTRSRAKHCCIICG